jgi:dolichyl-phosphate-mannose-protein mannosyltransferase
VPRAVASLLPRGKTPQGIVRTLWTALFLGLGSLIFFQAGIANPHLPLFDEIQYLDSSRALLAHAPNSNPEAPPLGKLIIALSIRSLGDTPFAWRMPSAVCGALTLVAVFLFLNLLLDDFTLGLTGAALTLFNNFLYVFARTAMMDIFLVTFAIWGVLAFLAALKIGRLGTPGRLTMLAISGVLFGCAIACKWNAVDELGVVLVLGGTLLLWSKPSRNKEFAEYAANLRDAGMAWFAISFLILPLLVYLATFWPLFRSQHISFSASELIAANLFIWRFHRNVVGNIALIIPCYRWALMIQPTRALSYLVGNWYVMWAGLAALLYCARRFARSLPETLIVSLYVINMLQWAVTPQQCMYYYYYFPAAMFVGMAIPIVLLRMPARCYGVRLCIVSVLPALCVFSYCFAHMAHLDAPYDTMLGYWP